MGDARRIRDRRPTHEVVLSTTALMHSVAATHSDNGFTMRRRFAWSRFAALIGMVALSGGACSEFTTGPEGDLISARNRWASLAPSAYSIIVSRACECTPEGSGPVLVVVRNGVVESRTYVQSGAVVATASANAFPTVDGLFALVEGEVRTGTRPVRAQYDPALGYPTLISVGEPERDAGAIYYARAFEAR
jgi:Family of unknown function (DUF6174)